MKHFMVLLLALLAFAQISAQPTQSLKKVEMPKKSVFQVKPFVTGPQFSKGLHGYDVVTLKDCELTTEVGAPQLPVKYMHFLIPPGKEVKTIKISKKSKTLDGDYKIIPAQPPYYPSADWRRLPFVGPDPNKYTKKIYPAKIAKVLHHGYFDGRARIVTIAVFPLQYSAAKKKLVYHSSLSFTFTYRDAGPDEQPIIVNHRSPDLQGKYNALLNSLIDNDIVDHSVYNPPQPLSLIEETVPKAEVLDYVIIAPQDFLKDHYFDAFINWKKAKGLNVFTKSLEDISSEYPEGDNFVPGDSCIVDLAGSVRKYLYEQYQNGLVYALLVGDNTIFPVRYGCGTSSERVEQDPEGMQGYIVPTDLYFADFNGKWNTDGDEYYGEPYNWESPTLGDHPDYFCEIFVGRVLVPSVDKEGGRQLSHWMDKLLTYETNPGNGDNDYLHKALYTISDGMATWSNVTDQIPFLRNHGWWVSGLFESPITGDLGTPTGAEVLDSLNAGYGLTSFNNHGDVHDISVSTTGENTSPRRWLFSFDSYEGSTDYNEGGNGLDNLEVTSKYFVNYSLSCDIGAYDWEERKNAKCMARTFTTLLRQKGGPAMIANTRYGSGTTASMLKNFLRVIYGAVTNHYPQFPVTNIGIALAGGKHLIWGSLESYSLNLFGDPEMPIWTVEPKQMIVNNLYEQGYVDVLDVRSGAMQGAKVHFWDEGTGKSVLQPTNSEGRAYCRGFKYSHVCVTQKDYLPVIQRIDLAAQESERVKPVTYEVTP